MDNKSSKPLTEMQKNFVKINTCFIPLKAIIKFFRNIRHQIKINLHKEWENNKLGIDPTIDGKPRLELEESKIISYNNSTKWMFVIFIRATYEIRVFFDCIF